MGLISVTNANDGEGIDANDINSPINTIVNEVNGNLSEANLANDAITTDKIATEAVTTSKIADEAVTPAKTSNIWWEELARDTLTTAGDNFTLNFTPKKYLQVYCHVLSAKNATGTYNLEMNYNDSGGVSFTYNGYEFDNTAPTNATNRGSIPLEYGSPDNQDSFIIINIMNQANGVKLTFIENMYNGTSTSGVQVPSKFWAKWVNTTDQINKIYIWNSGGAGNMDVGSEVVVLGHD